MFIGILITFNSDFNVHYNVQTATLCSMWILDISMMYVLLYSSVIILISEEKYVVNKEKNFRV